MDQNATFASDSNDSAALPPNVPYLATSHILYKIGHEINNVYFPIFVPIGVIGNILSFMVMMQKTNRHMSFSLYICVLSVSDTISLLFVIFDYMSQLHNINVTLEPYYHCAVLLGVTQTTILCSTLFIVAMTFERFYSIIRPHKAASFNTVKRAKVTIVCIVVFSFLFNFLHFFITENVEKVCVPYGQIRDEIYGQIYYWFSFAVNFAIPFILLLFMNSVIIHTLRKRSMVLASKLEGQGHGQGQGQNEGQSSKMKKSEKQIYITLLMVTFAFLILTTPLATFSFYTIVYDYTRTPEAFAGFYLYINVAPKLYYTNCGINFFLYVVSGQKFRTDLKKLFQCKKDKPISGSFDPSTKVSHIKEETSANAQS